MKTCTKCGVEKELGEFHRDRSKRDGYHNYCKACTIAISAAYHEANKERVAEKNRRWAKANPEKVAEINRRWAKANPENKAEMRRRWRKANPEKVAEIDRRWAKANPENKAEINRRWVKANPEKRAVIKNRRRARKKGSKVDETPADVARRTAVHFVAVWLREQGDDVHVDHIVPLSKGGADAYANMRIVPAAENMSKNDRMPTAEELAAVELLVRSQSAS